MKDLLSDLSRSRFGCLAIAALALLVLGYIALSMIFKVRTSDKLVYQPTPTFERTTMSIRGNSFEIPGGIAFIDGRDLVAQPPVTLMTIPLWDSPAELIEIAKMHHGDKVQLLEYREVPGSNGYVKVNYGGYSGWVSEQYLDVRANDPVGEEKSD